MQPTEATARNEAERESVEGHGSEKKASTATHRLDEGNISLLAQQPPRATGNIHTGKRSASTAFSENESVADSG